MNNYVEGNVIEFSGTWTTVDTDTPVDPTTVTFLYSVDGVTPTTFNYAGASIPAINTVARTGTGIYVVWISTLNNPGYYLYEFESTGAGQALEPGSCIVNKRPL